jgi:hypothetical protein
MEHTFNGDDADALLAEAAALFRRYEREHNRKAEDAIEKGDVANAESSIGKATTNGVMAGRIELFRAAAPTPPSQTGEPEPVAWQPLAQLVSSWRLEASVADMHDQDVRCAAFSRCASELGTLVQKHLDARALLSPSTPKPARVEILVDQDWLRRKSNTDPDVDVEAFTPPSVLALIALGWEVIESDGQVMTIQAPEGWEGDGPTEMVVDTVALNPTAPTKGSE